MKRRDIIAMFLVLGAAAAGVLLLVWSLVVLYGPGPDGLPTSRSPGGPATEAGPEARARRKGPALSMGPVMPAGDFWLEQYFPEGAHEGTKLHLARRDDGSSVFVRLGAGRAELLSSRGGPGSLASGDLPLGLGEIRRLVARRLGAKIEIACVGAKDLAPRVVLALSGDEFRGLDLAGRAAVEVPAGAPALSAPRVQPLGGIVFADDFIRARPSGQWRPLSGRWELSQIAFSENSANAFALRCGVGMPVRPSPLWRRRWRRSQSGMGVLLGTYDNLPRIERITGLSPAEAAGLKEEDIIVEVNGQDAMSADLWQIVHGLRSPRGGKVQLKILRPGERTFRNVTVEPGSYVWGKIRRGVELESSSDPGDQGDEALAVAGRLHWSDYRASVSVSADTLTGGMGLAFYVSDAANHWRFEAVSGGPGEGTGPELRLVAVSGGKPEILASREWRWRPLAWYRLAVEVRGDQAACLLDGVEIFRSRLTGAFAGRIGLWAGGPGSFGFDDVEVRSAGEPVPAVQKPTVRSVLLREQDMQNWGNPASDWITLRDDGVAWYRYRLPGQPSAWLDDPKYDDLEIGLMAEATSPGSGVVARVSRRSGRMEIVSGAKVLASGPSPSGGPVRAWAGGDRVHLSVGSGGATREISAELTGTRPAGDRLWIRGLHSIHEPGAALAASSGCFDHTFQKAPADWLAYGVWDVVNKWICDPRWSWYGGRSDVGMAALWTKRRFAGDVSLDAYLAVMMTSDDQPYERSGDYNVAICCEPGDLGSGYALVFGGDNCTVTRLYRKGRVVAETREEASVPASNVMEIQPKPVLHQRWFRVSMERTGSRVVCRYDGRAVLEYDDPEPIEGGHACIWTMRNGILVSRAVVTGSSVERTSTPSWEAGSFSDPLVTNVVGDFPRTCLAATERSRGGRTIYRASSPAGVGGGNLFVRLAGLRSGREAGERLRFDFRAPPGTKVDLVLQQGDLMPRFRLTGPPDTDGQAPVIGEARGVAADGEWRSVEIDLGSAWRSWWRRRGMSSRTYTGRVYLGCSANDGYLLAGLGGNGPGSWYEFTFPEVVRPQARAAGPTLSVSALPFAGGAGARATWRVETRGAGFDPVGVHVRALGRSFGDSSPALTVDEDAGTVSFDLDRAGIEVPEGAEVELSLCGVRDVNGRAAAENSVRWTNAAGADRTGPVLEAVITSRPSAGWHSFEEPPSGLSQPVACDPGGVALVRERRDDGSGYCLSVENLRTASRYGLRLFAGSIDPGLYPVLEFDYAMGGDVPLNVRLDGLGVITLTDRHSRESPWTRGVQIAGSHDGLVTDGRWHRASVNLLRILTERYPSRAGHSFSDLYLADAGWLGNRAGTRMRLDNVHLLPAVSPAGLRLRVKAFDVSGVSACAAVLDSHPGTIPAPELAAPVAGPKPPDGPEAKPQAPSARWSSGADFAQEVAPADGLADGRGWIHVRAQDLSGNWGETVHLPVIVDSTAPVPAEVTPRPGGPMPSRMVRVKFSEAGSLDPSTVSLKVGAKGRYVEGRHRRFDAGTLELVVDLGDPGFDEFFRPGEDVTVELTSAADRVGNAIAEPVEWTWRYDPAADTVPPPAPRVRFSAAGRGGAMGFMRMGGGGDSASDFEDLLSPVFAFGGCTVERTDEASSFGRYSAAVRANTPGGLFRLRLRDSYYKATVYTRFAFDCLLPEGSTLDLEADLMGVTRTVGLVGSRPGVEYHGRARGVAFGGGWRRFYVDLEAACREELDRMPLKYGRHIYLVGRMPAGGVMHVDNVELARADWPGGRLEWEMPADPCPGGVGAVRGFSYVYDRMPGTVPPEKVTAAVPGAIAPGEPAGSFPPPFSLKGGLWYFHIRALDGSGNWGPASHYPVDLGRLDAGGAGAVPAIREAR